MAPYLINKGRGTAERNIIWIMAGLTKESQTTSRNYLPTTFGAWDTLLHVACKKNYSE